MALKAKSSDTNESSDDENSKMKSYITRQFKKTLLKALNIRNNLILEKKNLIFENTPQSIEYKK